MSIIPDGKGVEQHADNEVAEFEDTPVPGFLKVTYVIVSLLGLIALLYFWNGSRGYFDRGYWYELQVAAGTTREVSSVTTPRLQEINTDTHSNK